MRSQRESDPAFRKVNICRSLANPRFRAMAARASDTISRNSTHPDACRMLPHQKPARKGHTLMPKYLFCCSSHRRCPHEIQVPHSTFHLQERSRAAKHEQNPQSSKANLLWRIILLSTIIESSCMLFSGTNHDNTTDCQK